MERENIKNKEDYINYILFELSNKIHPVDFVNFFLELNPTSGINNFRDLLDELNEIKLVTKSSEPKGSVPGFPHLTTIDLKYSISLKGIEYLKNNNIIQIKMHKKEVFVTYSWDSEEHNGKVLSFTNFLRSEGFEAEIDKLHSQQETATDFYKMMHQAMTHYDKVIVVLSKGYKEKAEDFRGGVGNEYSLIIKDIETSKNKYILVSFEGINDEITPLNFKGRNIINLSEKKNLNELFAKLKGENIIEFAQVGKQKPFIEKKNIDKFELQDKKVEISNLDFRIDSTSQFAQLYTKVDYDLYLELKNNTNETFSDYSLEIYFPKNSTDYTVDGRIEGNYKVISYDSNPKIFPQQSKSLKIEKFFIRHFTAEEILNDKIIVKIYSEKGLIEKDFILNQVLFVNSPYGKEKLEIEKFQDKNYR